MIDYTKFIEEFNATREAFRDVWEKRDTMREQLKAMNAEIDRFLDLMTTQEKQMLEIDASGNEVTVDLRGRILRIEKSRTSTSV
jgi:ABC-type enterochelin transport system substrate-binding protein